ncbi:hypothetical protein CROQUDRAFT_135051 [Cronartium quercuum f. sp. fusiforme G11]|uniref:Uncharacterized protein n=1 Tax=Cronartium quercuum f. sp. fusiforme G11 TaxID=708437 RepID=A0A9P6NCE6_9BASI|nr:hypothetical protein CROQUDRAFT_135051 [Cronartium quercuum f. sp. fusiforme G11]
MYCFTLTAPLSKLQASTKDPSISCAATETLASHPAGVASPSSSVNQSGSSDGRLSSPDVVAKFISSFATQEAGRAAGNTVHEFRPVTRRPGQQNPDLGDRSVADSDAPFIADSDQEENVDDGFWSTEHNENTVYEDDPPDGLETNEGQPFLSVRQREPLPSDLGGKVSPEKSAEKENPKPVFQTIKSLFEGAYNQLLEYARLIRDKIRFWLKSPHIPLFSEADVLKARFKPLFEKMDELLANEKTITAYIEHLAREMSGKENKDPHRFYTSEHKEWAKKVEQESQKDSAQHLKETLVDFYRRILNAKKAGIVANFDFSQAWLKAHEDSFETLFRRTDDRVRLEDYAKRARKTREKMEPLRLKFQPLCLYLELFGPANIGAPKRGVALELSRPGMISGPEKGSNEVKKIDPNWTAKTAIEMKTLEWQLPKEKVVAIFKQHWPAYDAFEILYEVQSAESHAARTGRTLSYCYKDKRLGALRDLGRVYGKLMKVFKTQEELKKDFASIHKIINSGTLADEKESPLEWTLFPLMEPVGPGRTLMKLKNYHQLANTLGFEECSEFAHKYDELVKSITEPFADHYENAQQLRALRLEFESIFNEKGQRRIWKTLYEVEAPGKPNSRIHKRK